MTARRVLAFSLGMLLALGAVLSRPSPADPAKTDRAGIVAYALPPIPDSVISMRGWVRVHFVPGVFLCGMVEALGCYTYESRFMQVDTALSRTDQWLVLEHEEVHMIFGDAGLTARERGHDRDHVDDDLADAIAEVRVLERSKVQTLAP